MTTPRRRRVALFVAALLAVTGLVIGVHGLRWRAEVIGLKIAGRIPTLGWSDMLRMLPPRSGYYLEPLIETGNAYASIENPYAADIDSAAGARQFRLSCTQCHQGQAHGAPDLGHAALRHPSDWALYQTIRNGLVSTAMPAHPELSDRETWQLITYIKAIRRAFNIAREATAPRTTVPIGAIVFSGRNPADWVTYSGAYDDHRFSTLAQVNRGNVTRLRPVWMFQPTGADEKNESSPIVVGGAMYVTTGPNGVWALDARTGRILWHFAHLLPPRLSLCCSTVNRGVAVLDSAVFVGTLDAHLIALDAGTGKARWDIQVADGSAGYSITSAPLVTPEGVIIGVAGGEFGITGVIDAYDPRTGKRLWRFHSIPQPGEPGHETWSGDSWKTGGAPPWLTGAYDTATHTLYWGVGNPGPDYAGAPREGANLYSNSVVALDAATGRLKWYFQFTPHDEHDWDAAQVPILLDANSGGRPRHLLLWANRNGFYYVLDRVTGAFLHGVPFDQVSWASGLDSLGAPHVLPGSSPTDSGAFVYPSVVGATNWWSPSYDPQQNLMLVPTLHLGGTFYLDKQMSRGGLITGGATSMAFGQSFWDAVKALDPLTGAEKWEFRYPAIPEDVSMGGITSTAGGLVFTGDGTLFVALDAATGKELWSFPVGGSITAAPVVFAEDGKERIALMAGHTLITFGLDEP